MHEEPSEFVWHLSQKMARWLRWHDGCYVLQADKSEAGWYNVPERGDTTTCNPAHGDKKTFLWREY